MKCFLVFLATLLALASAQLPLTGNELDKPWKGPIADHQLGLAPGDTPEVAAAKMTHFNAFKDVLAVLPELPPEERYKKTGLPLNELLALMQRAQQQLNVPVEPIFHHDQRIVVPLTPQSMFVPSAATPAYIPEQHFIPQPVQKVPNNPAFTVFAEEIPRSPFGEVPEVYEARLAHLKAYNEARALAAQRV